MAAAMSGRICFGPIQTGSFINGDKRELRTPLGASEKEGHLNETTG
jgi:hypothetical protein